jgi:hypothetical protein
MFHWPVLSAAFALSTPPTAVVELSNGDVIRGALIARSETSLVVEHPVLGRMEIPAADVVSVTLEDQGAQQALGRAQDAPAQIPAPPPGEPQPAAPPPPPPKPRWVSHLDFGLSGSAGVTETADLRIAFTTALKEPTQAYTFDASYLVKSSDGDITDNKATTGILADWPLAESRWGLFAQGRYDYDDFQSWKHRISGGGGVTYLLVDINRVDDAGAQVDEFDLIGRLGAGFNKEFGSLDEDIKPELIAGLDLSWQISPRQSLVGSTALYPNLEDLEDFRIVSKLEWRHKIDTFQGMSMVAGLAHEYQREPDPGISPNDLTVYVALGLDF